jgi:hypothetical protein
LSVGIDEDYSMLLADKFAGEVDGDRRFSRSTLQIGHCDESRHGAKYTAFLIQPNDF